MFEIKAYLVLPGNEIIEAESFGAEGTAVGEIAFNSGIVDYHGVISDPASEGYVTMMAYPLIGNVGIREEEMDAPALSSGLIVREYCNAPSNFRFDRTLSEYLVKYGVKAVCGIDTRALTRRIASGKGEAARLKAAVTTEDMNLPEVKDRIFALVNSPELEKKELAAGVKEDKHFGPCGDTVCGRNIRIAVYDLGGGMIAAKALTIRGAEVIVVPRTADAAHIASLNPDGILISDGSEANGLEDAEINKVKDIIALSIPTLALGFGHVLCAAALGAETEKLALGHRGVNCPVFCYDRNRTYITNQNHGFIVKSGSLVRALGEITQKNINDSTAEAIKYKNYPLNTVQYRPDQISDEHSTGWVYDGFISECMGRH